jgi:predicted secreted Zn-dependent protease
MDGGMVCIGAKVLNSTVNPQATVEMPDWKNKPASCQSAWEQFMCELRAHERTHAEIGERNCRSAANAMSGLTVKACAANESSARAAADKKLAEAAKQAGLQVAIAGQAEQDEFDRETDHGSITMDCSCEE